MSDLQLLFLVLALLYGWECACWLRPGSVAFTTWIGRRWRLQHPGALVGNDRGGFILAAPLPPLGTLFTANQIPFSCSPDALLSFVATNVNPGSRMSQVERLFRFDEINKVQARGKRVLINGIIFLRSGSQTHASHLAGQIGQLRNQTPKQREAVIVAMHRDSLDATAVEQRWNDLKKTSRLLRWLTNTLVVFVFVLIPVVLWKLGLGLSWKGLLAGLIALDTATAVAFHVAHRKLFLSAEDDRFTHTLTIFLSPASAMRAHDTLSRPLFETFHPLAVGKVFLTDGDFRTFARRVLLDICNPALPLCPTGDAVATDTEAHSRITLQKVVGEFLKQHGTDMDDLLRPPASADDSCLAYCPRCGEQFTTNTAQCADCGGLAVIPFGK